MNARLDLQPRESGPYHQDRTGDFGADVDREREAVFDEIERVFRAVPSYLPLETLQLPCKSAMHDAVVHQSIASVLPELLTHDDVLRTLVQVLRSETGADLRTAMVAAYDEMYGGDVATIRAGAWA